MKIYSTALALITAIALQAQEDLKIPDTSKAADIQIEGLTDESLYESFNNPEADDNKIYDFATAQIKPNFPGGEKRLKNYLKDNIRTNAITGVKSNLYVIEIQFVIEKDGTMSGITTLTSPDKSMTNEIIRAMKSVKTRWQPGINNGKPVRCSHTLDVEVKIP